MLNTYHCHLFDTAGNFFAVHDLRAETQAQAIDLCAGRMKAEAKTRECIGFEIWQDGRRRHRIYDSTMQPPLETKIIAGV